ncbi:DEDDh family exonuclease [Streptomyces sp. NPDC007903]|uniref:DEDDh family exonuclease n=1 Tax=Streptomyces sp. NPDC007903 TaxID=3364786 RepID=UPI0036EF090C
MTLGNTAFGSLTTPFPSDYAHEWALVDVETSGLVARRDRVLSIAVVTMGPDGERTGEFSALVNPGCDPGPVHVHGLTRERLSGAPDFEQVAGEVEALLRGRVMVAHNAQFDYGFLDHEFSRAGRSLPVSRRLCTLALNRRLELPTPDLKLGTLAAHYGVPQTKAHDALDDTRVLAGIFGASLREAARIGLALPLVSCPPRQNARFAPSPPKTPCAYRNPGRLAEGGPLVQGMKVAITGETATARTELIARSVAAGLNMVGSVSRHTSVLVTDDAVARSTKARRAAAEGVPVIDEATFLRLLGDVRPGTPHQDPVIPAPRSPKRQEPAAPKADKPLAGRRVLILGGPHADAAAARTRLVELGGSAAVNLSRGVTDVLLLAEGDQDRRMARVTELGLPVRDAGWLAGAGTPGAPAPAEAPSHPAALVLPRGGVTDLPDTTQEWHLTANWAPPANGEVDVVAFVLDEEGQVTFDEDFVFYGAPENPGGTVRLLADGPAEQTVTIDLAALPPAFHRVAVAAAVDGDMTFGDIGAVEVTAAPGGGDAPLARATLDAATTERTLLLAELYRRGPVWRFRAVGQGHDHGLAELARGYGVDVAG